MQNNLKKSMERFGACLNLTLTGKADALSLYVNQLYNYGVISNIPEDYDEKQDTSVMVQTDTGRIERGFTARAIQLMEANPFICRTFKGKPEGFKKLAVSKARAMIATEFQEVETIYADEATRKDVYLFGSGTIHDYGWSNETVS